MKKKPASSRPELPPPSAERGCPTCNGLCCRHIALQLDTPSGKTDYDNLRWFLMHERVSIGIDHEDNWMLEVTTPCRHLRNNRCEIYAKRPRICKKFPGAGDACEHEDESSPYKFLFPDETALERYLVRKKIDWEWR